MNRGLLLGLPALALLVACGPDAPDEERIRARIEAMQTALSEGDVRAFMAPVADDFTASTRNLDRRAARFLLRREMLAHDRLRARLADIEITLHGQDRAMATMHAVTTGGSGQIPETGGWYRVNTGWRRDGGDWMMISASWENVVARP